jgi:hypothetical protein
MVRLFLFLNFDDDDMNVGGADVLDGVRWIRRRPDSAGAGFVLSAVEFDVAVGIAANHVRATEDVLHSGPAVSVDWNKCTGWDEDVEDADVFVFEDESVEVGRGDECVERGGPGWGGSRHGLRRYNKTGKHPLKPTEGLNRAPSDSRAGGA